MTSFIAPSVTLSDAVSAEACRDRGAGRDARLAGDFVGLRFFEAVGFLGIDVLPRNGFPVGPSLQKIAPR
jgi:hypothetical protein